jgi:Ricin-type beta-trefoil lectin domain-like
VRDLVQPRGPEEQVIVRHRQRRPPNVLSHIRSKTLYRPLVPCPSRHRPLRRHYKVIAKHSGKCLDIAGVSTADGANVQQWSCYGGNNQRWRPVPID